MTLKGTQVSSNQKQSSTMSSPAKAQLAGAPATSSRVMRNSSSLRAKGGETTFPGLAGLVGVGPDSNPGGLVRIHFPIYNSGTQLIAGAVMPWCKPVQPSHKV